MERKLLVQMQRCWKIYFLINKLDNGKSNERVAEAKKA